jgi:hypothetical protein
VTVWELRFDRSTVIEKSAWSLPEFCDLLPHMPPERKPWMSEDARIAIFDAASFAIALFKGVGR